ncbi:cytochrome c biogenesis protein [Calidifontibacillus erzurumensis]|uniref:Cytochrome c biogenesis protein CcsA n=1 Tax=Calidifontibacillus erzurumensis TaxID=2741433 RepID=A0A8J8GEA8_9BACI|nr:cytochrome c biogenesis protein [Calidifontibacillus erzurumensis]NSL51581.1 cytochrome c biogenesis protein CcsA [Calidifontibacillus erzurumensis]
MQTFIYGWIYDITIILYACSVLGYFIDFLQNNRKANKIAFWLLAIVWILQSIFLVSRMFEMGRFPILTMAEGLYFYTWVLVSFSLIINKVFRIDLIVFFTNVLGFIIMALHLFASVEYKSDVLAEKLISELLIIHITIAIISYGAFTLSAIFSMMYMLQYHMIKRKKWNKQLWRLEDLSKLDRLSYTFNMSGVPMLLISLILGVNWAYISLEDFKWYDVKIIGSFIVLITYSIYLYLRVAKGIQGKAIVLWNLAAFLILLINFFLLGSLSGFHFWYG